ncbi:GSCOCG00000816001-RA-CDS [Cotesia congregata]|nr:GSCOCG00000816001-RA-CDS [Cotesia congregata]
MEKNNQTPDYASSVLTELSYHNRILNLDDIILPAGWAVVGVKFQHSRGNPIVLQIAGVKIIDELGNPIISHDVHWFLGTNNFNRNEITKSDLDIPTLGKKKNGELSEPGKHYVKFQMTGWAIDAGQTLIPFIDMQEVVANPPAPIGGVGLHYNGQDGYGGFIAPKLISMNNTIYMSENYLKKTFNDTRSRSLNQYLSK